MYIDIVEIWFGYANARISSFFDRVIFLSHDSAEVFSYHVFILISDGTICDQGWIGYNGNCYLFYTGNKMNFTSARDFCISNEAEMLSILDDGEHTFLKEARSCKSSLLLFYFYLFFYLFIYLFFIVLF